MPASVNAPKVTCCPCVCTVPESVVAFILIAPLSAVNVPVTLVGPVVWVTPAVNVTLSPLFIPNATVPVSRNVAPLSTVSVTALAPLPNVTPYPLLTVLSVVMCVFPWKATVPVVPLSVTAPGVAAPREPWKVVPPLLSIVSVAMLSAGPPTVIVPAVPEGSQLLRTSYMATHTDAQLDRVLDSFQRVAKQVGLI